MNRGIAFIAVFHFTACCVAEPIQGIGIVGLEPILSSGNRGLGAFALEKLEEESANLLALLQFDFKSKAHSSADQQSGAGRRNRAMFLFEAVDGGIWKVEFPYESPKLEIEFQDVQHEIAQINITYEAIKEELLPVNTGAVDFQEYEANLLPNSSIGEVASQLINLVFDPKFWLYWFSGIVLMAWLCRQLRRKRKYAHRYRV